LSYAGSSCQFLPAHDSLFLLRNVLTAPRLMLLLRATQYFVSPVLPPYDTVLPESLSVTPMSLNVGLDELRWNQASLPVRWGGLGVCGVVLRAPSTFLYSISTANSSELTSALPPPRLRDVKDTGFDPALTAWTIQATNSSTPSTYATFPSNMVTTG
jgi:hypothetical protein